VAVVTASWVSLTGQQNELQTKIHLTNWNTYSWHETSEADFNDGTNDNTIVSSFESEDFVTLAKEGENYFSAGTYTSNVFDSQSEDTNYFAIKWQSVDAPTSTLLIKVRASNQPDLEGAVWVDHEAGKLPAEVQNKKYFQYQAAFTSNGIEADVLNSIEINYK